MPVRLRPAVLDDAEALAALARSQREHLAPWEPERPARWFTEAGQRETLEQADRDRAADRSYAFVITDDAGHLLGLARTAKIDAVLVEPTAKAVRRFDKHVTDEREERAEIEGRVNAGEKS